MPPLVSVIIPCYNGERYITDAIRSVENQTYDRIELIVVDDGSTDDSVEVVRSLSTDIKLTLVKTESNSGISATRNRGLEHAKGKYIGILDQDDIWYEQKVECQVSYMESNPDVGVTYTDMDKIDTDGDLFDTITIDINPIEMTDEELVTYLFRYWENEPSLALTSELIRRDVFDRIGTYDEDLYGANDRDLLFRCIRYFDVAHINKVLMAKRYHNRRASHHSHRLLADRRKLTKKMIAQYPFLNAYKAEREAHINLGLALYNTIDRNFVDTAINLGAALRSAPLFSVRQMLAAISN